MSAVGLIPCRILMTGRIKTVVFPWVSGILIDLISRMPPNSIHWSNRRAELLLPPLPRTHLATFTAVRSNLSLPSCQGALEERINRCLSCQSVTFSLAEVICIKEWISYQLCQNMSLDLCIREPSKCGCKGCESPVRIID